MLAVGIVDSQHGKLQNPLSCHRLQPKNARGGFLTASPDILSQIRSAAVKEPHQIPSVIDYDVRLVLETHFYVAIVLLLSGTVICENGNAVLHKSCAHIILGAQVVAACSMKLRAPCCQHLAEIRCLGLKMY